MKAKFKAVGFLVATLVNIMILPKTDAAFRGNLSVRVDGLKNQKGQVCLNIFAASKGFPNNSQRAVKARCIKVRKNPTIVTFSSLKAGNYAVAVIHDENGVHEVRGKKEEGRRTYVLKREMIHTLRVNETGT
ncbi:MAG: DUF2141 domain-containing protein [Cyanobacteria bacterium P01_H01_bin.150]